MSATEDTVSSLGAQSTPGTALEEERQVLLLLCSRGIFFLRFYLFLERGKGERKRGRETSMCGCLSHALNWGSGPQPRYGNQTGNPLVLRLVLSSRGHLAVIYQVLCFGAYRCPGVE